ncbi:MULTISPECIES: hypothetical protein [unclassified Streptomyces]|nr:MULTISPECIES: hypothetical protein [unclassified Streptomyces]SCF70979.1 hypothetical protein GA0115259_1013611 [Streptomyces sp. MnatMP-M17]
MLRVRDPGSQRAEAFEAFGARLVRGDLYDRDSVRRNWPVSG